MFETLSLPHSSKEGGTTYGVSLLPVQQWGFSSEASSALDAHGPSENLQVSEMQKQRVGLVEIWQHQQYQTDENRLKAHLNAPAKQILHGP